ncbi:Z1 domain-containing protein [Sphingobacterium thalpophilum]|uniref:Z1 domain-containing protein n=1 Tax=Sphingobacterium thalpophilum TaxID=259 RepID=A0ACD5C4Z8_9SPHI
MSNYQQAKTLCNAWLSEIAKTESVNAVLIKEKVGQVNTLFNLPESEKVKLIEELEVLYSILSDHYRILDDVKPDPWVKNAKSEINWDFWNRYRMYLEQKNYAPDTLNKMDNLTDDILDRLIRPDSNIPSDKRGLIVGHVQSGKTGNYIGLMCKAADAGYRLIIVLAGIHNSLRSQTQLRIDEGFLGFDTQLARSITQTSDRIGVGRINPTLIAHSLTTNEINGDFNRKASETSGISIGGKDPIILVIKKNASVMKNLLGWLASRGKTMEDGKKQIKNLPLLVIDDEADNASINISKNYVSGINACIRSMLKLFEQSAYIGYTATPYANIFIKQYTDDDVKGLDFNVHNIPLSLGKDIFPKNFIVNIPAPSNYIGPEKLFGIESLENIDKEIEPLELIRVVDDYAIYIPEGHKKDEPKPETLTELPLTLHEAIKCFFLSCAARRARGQANEHNSMLVHVTRFIDWQDRIATLVENQVRAYARLIEFPNRKFLGELEQLWKDRFVKVTKQVIDSPSVNDPSIVEMSWADIEPHLYAAVAKIEIRAVHGDTNINRLKHKNIRPLDYYDHRKTGLSVIAVGGNKLSRGLTLEGLTISYFLRASKMYDTLMQMGRWFGYRPGYLDLCRLYTSEELVKWYQHITVATEEMRAEFDRMGDLDKTPADYGLKVRTHPDSLVITAANKFRYKKIMTLSLSGVLEETYSFKKNDPKHLVNYNNTLKLINDLGLPNGTINTESILRNHFVWRGRNNADRIIDYLYGYASMQPTFNVNLINRFISEQQKYGLITNWTIVLINNTTTDKTVKINTDITVGLTKRSDFTPDSNYYTINKSHIIDPRHEFIDLTDEEIEIAFKRTIEDAKKNGKNLSKIDKPSPVRVKEIRPDEQALLLIYLLDPQPKEDKAPLSSIPIVGLAVSFPWMKNARPIEYAVNEQFLKELDYSDELDDQELEEPLIAVEKDNELEQLEVLENRIENKFKELEGKTQKWNPTFLYGTNKLNYTEKKPEAVPVIKAKDVQRYYINPYVDSWIENPEHLLINKGLVISTVKFQAQNFSISETSLVLDGECLAIWIPEIPSEYLSAILNSVFFTYYNRSKIGLATEQVIETFPFIYSEQYSHGISILVRCILVLQKEQSSRESHVMSSFFISVLDAVIFEVYFPEIFAANRLNVLSELQSLIPFDNDAENIKRYYQLLNKPQSHVKKAIYDITTIPEFKLIYQTLTNENQTHSN